MATPCRGIVDEFRTQILPYNRSIEIQLSPPLLISYRIQKIVLVDQKYARAIFSQLDSHLYLSTVIKRT